MDELQGPLPNGNVRVLEAVYDGGAVSLHGGGVELHHLSERVEGHVPDVVVSVREKPVGRRGEVFDASEVGGIVTLTTQLLGFLF